MKKDNNDGKYWEELLKFINKDVIVETFLPNGKMLETKGTLRGFNYQYMTCVVMTKTEKIIVKTFHRIRRKRDYKDETK